MDKWQQSWAVNKYWVMAHSQQIYNEIRKLASKNEWSEEKDRRYQALLDKAAEIKPTVKTLTTAYQHVWGYFKRSATLDEKMFYLHELEALSLEKDTMGPFLANLTVKYQVQYLLHSRLLISYLEQ
ncbi:YbgA family protein [Liquorilactobacillus aquaticus]|nr:YbgA family protein [Liquorilactobacillus aquaticus]